MLHIKKIFISFVCFNPDIILIMKHTVYIILGSNIEDRFFYLSEAGQLLSERVGRVTLESSIYETEVWGFEHPVLFLNKVLCVKTNIEPLELLQITQQIEIELGRTQKGGDYKARTIDIDLLFYDDIVFNSTALNIPHPQIQNRKFELIPLVEIAPDFVHPKLKRTMLELLSVCTDTLNVVKL